MLNTNKMSLREVSLWAVTKRRVGIVDIIHPLPFTPVDKSTSVLRFQTAMLGPTANLKVVKISLVPSTVLGLR